MTPSRSGTLDLRNQRPRLACLPAPAQPRSRVCQHVSCLAAGLLRGHRRRRSRDCSRKAAQAMGAAVKIALSRASALNGGAQRGAGRKIAPGGARSLHFGRDDNKKERPRAALPHRFPCVRAEHPKRKCINFRSLPEEEKLRKAAIFYPGAERQRLHRPRERLFSAPCYSARRCPRR